MLRIHQPPVGERTVEDIQVLLNGEKASFLINKGKTHFNISRNGNGLLYELNIDIDDDSDFSIYDAVLSMINIEIIKKIQKFSNLLLKKANI